MNIRFTKKEWQTAQNLKQMLTEGKTLLEINSSIRTEDVKIDKTKSIIESFIKEVQVAEIYNHILEMEPVDQEDYNKIMESLLKRFSNPYIKSKITIPESTISKFNLPYEPETEESNGLIIIAFCLAVIVIGLIWYYIRP